MSPDADADRAAAIVASVLGGAFDLVHELHERVVGLVAASGGSPSAADLAALAPYITDELGRPGALPVGLGFIAEAGVVSDQPLWLEWWQHPEEARGPDRLQVDLRPGSLGFYDYQAAEWFAVPRAIRCRHVVGPYVDVHGTARYLLTLTEPVVVGDRFVGVVGADLPLAGFEEAVLPALAAAGDWSIVNAEGRVVVATSSRWVTGDRMPAPSRRGAVPVPGSGWEVVQVAGS